MMTDDGWAMLWLGFWVWVWSYVPVRRVLAFCFCPYTPNRAFVRPFSPLIQFASSSQRHDITVQAHQQHHIVFPAESTPWHRNITRPHGLGTNRGGGESIPR